MPKLLVELFSEEMPAGLQEPGAKYLRDSFLASLDKEGLKYGKSKIYWSPMRLCLIIEDICSQTEDLNVEKRGPRIGSNETAINGFAKSLGIKVQDLSIKDTSKGEFYFYNSIKEGISSTKIIANTLKEVINNFSWSKSMRWGTSNLRWVRPLHSIICLFDKTLISFSIEDIKSSNTTFGHRFINPKEIVIDHADNYTSLLKSSSVVIDANERIKIIKNDGKNLAENNQLVFSPSENLLKEVANLIECPYLFISEFDKDYLSLPEDVLKLTMMKQQKYFPLMNKNNKISNKYIAVSNVPVNKENIIIGNSRVLRARLADAAFFYQNDVKTGLTMLSKGLKNIIFHRLLGSMDSKVDRIKYLTRKYQKAFAADKNLTLAAAELCKADLCSEVVYEMPELQGVIGSKYSEIEGLDKKITLAIKEHYSPLGPHDICPTAPESVLLSFADKLDSLVGFIGIDLRPSGSKDPYGIRRSGIGLIRLILDNNIRLSLKKTIESVYDLYIEQNIKLNLSKAKTINVTMEFLMDRLKGLVRDKKISQSCISSVCNITKQDDIYDIVQRIYALNTFISTDDGKLFIKNLKRVRRILDIEEKKCKITFDGKINTQLFKQKEEEDLYKYYKKIDAETISFLREEKYEKAMSSFLSIEKKLEIFFENVQINIDEEEVKLNRLNILSNIRKTFFDYADFSLIEIENDVK